MPEGTIDEFDADMLVNSGPSFHNQFGSAVQSGLRTAARVGGAGARTAFSAARSGAKTIGAAILKKTTSAVAFVAQPITIPVSAVYSATVSSAERRNQRMEERANERFELKNAGMINALSKPLDGGLMTNVTLRNMITAQAQGKHPPMDAEEAIRLATIGEHVCKALADGREVGPEGLAVTIPGATPDQDQTVMVPPGNFAARAVSWHLMATAAHSDLERQRVDPLNKRSDMTNSGTFIMKDPGNRIYNFLNANPMVMDRMSTHYEERLDHDKHVPILNKTLQKGCDDYQNKLPGGGGALLFDKMKNGEVFVKFEHAGTPNPAAREKHETRGHAANRAILALDRWRAHTLSFLDSRGAGPGDPNKVVRQEHLHKGEMKQPIYDPYLAALSEARKAGLISKKDAKEMKEMAKTHGLPSVQAGLQAIEAQRQASPDPNSPANQRVSYATNVVKGNIDAKIESMGQANNALGIERRGGEVHISPDPNRYATPQQRDDFVQAASFTMSRNDMMTSAQANETHKLTAQPGHVLGKDGQTMAFAKYHFDSLDRQIQTARDRIEGFQQEQARLQASSNAIRASVPEGTPLPGHLESLITRNEAQIATLNAKIDVQAERAAKLNQFRINGMMNANPLVREDVIDTGRQIGLLARSAASYATDNLLQLDTHAEERLGTDMDGIPISVSVQAPGAGITSDYQDKSCFLEVDYRDPRIQRGLSDLEATDYITGQIDRHMGNIFIDPESGKVTGIDNDLAFPEVPRNELTNGAAKAIATVPQFMHEETAQKILATSPQELEATLRAIPRPPGVEGLSEQAIAGAVSRLQELQAAIKNPSQHGMTIVQGFDDNTYRDCMIRQTRAFNNAPGNGAAGITFGSPAAGSREYGGTPRTSYLGAVMVEQQLNRLGQTTNPNACGIRDARSVPPLGVDRDVAEFKQATAALKNGYLANPQRLPEGSPERKLMGELHQQMQPLQARLDDINAKIEKLRNPSRLDQLKAAVKGGVQGEIASLREKQAAVLQQLRPLEKQLDQALDRTIDPQRQNLRMRMEDKAALGIQQQMQAREARAVVGFAAGQAAEVARERAQRRGLHANHLTPLPAPRQNQRPANLSNSIGDVSNLQKADINRRQSAQLSRSRSNSVNG